MEVDHTPFEERPSTHHLEKATVHVELWQGSFDL